MEEQIQSSNQDIEKVTTSLETSSIQETSEDKNNPAGIGALETSSIQETSEDKNNPAGIGALETSSIQETSEDKNNPAGIGALETSSIQETSEDKKQEYANVDDASDSSTKGTDNSSAEQSPEKREDHSKSAGVGHAPTRSAPRRDKSEYGGSYNRDYGYSQDRDYNNRRNDYGKGDDSGRRTDSFKDRDLRRNKFRKYDRISAKKLDIDYKKPEILQEFLTENGKILSRIITGNSSQNQHLLTREVKRARYIGLLPSA